MLEIFNSVIGKALMKYACMNFVLHKFPLSWNMIKSQTSGLCLKSLNFQFSERFSLFWCCTLSLNIFSMLLTLLDIVKKKSWGLNKVGILPLLKMFSEIAFSAAITEPYFRLCQQFCYIFALESSLYLIIKITLEMESIFSFV